MKVIAATLVYGFIEAGKTTYIQDQILNSPSHAQGATLILCFEEGQEEYDERALSSRQARVAYYRGGESVPDFCRRMLEQFDPNRVFVEMNGMRHGLREKLPGELNVVRSVMLIDGTTLPIYMANMRQHLQNMVVASDVILFNRCQGKQVLLAYGPMFQLMNHRAGFLWVNAEGKREKAFDAPLPFDEQADDIEVNGSNYISFILTALIHPECCDGKSLRLFGQYRDGRIGRTVMTCCPADLQFLGIPCDGLDCPDNAWISVNGIGEMGADDFGQKRLLLRAISFEIEKPPKQPILSTL